MTNHVDFLRRGLLRGVAAGAGIAGLQLALGGKVASASGIGSPALALAHLKNIDAGVLNIAYYEAGPVDGPAVVLLHGFPYDIEAYAEVAPILVAAGCRVIVPYLRGFGPTRFLTAGTLRSGEFAAFGADLLALLDALSLPRAVLAGYDWGGKAASAVAALWPRTLRGPGIGQRLCILRSGCGVDPGEARKRNAALVAVLLPDRARTRRLRKVPPRVQPAFLETMVTDLALRRRDLRTHGPIVRQRRPCRSLHTFVPPPIRRSPGRPRLCRDRS